MTQQAEISLLDLKFTLKMSILLTDFFTLSTTSKYLEGYVLFDIYQDA